MWRPLTAEPTILGVEVPLWTETAEIIRDLEWLAFPRLATHADRRDNLDINYYRSPLVEW